MQMHNDNDNANQGTLVATSTDTRVKHQTRNDIDAEKRDALIGVLNANLAHAMHLNIHAKQAHWNVKGPSFSQLHELFEQIADAAKVWSDDIAERATALGGVAEGNLASIQQRSGLPGYGLELTSGPEHVAALADSIAALAAETRKAAHDTEDIGDLATSDLFVEITQAADKWLWFLESHLQADR